MMNKIDLTILTRQQAVLVLQENLNRESIFSGLRHKNYHVRLLALRKIGLKNRYRFLALQKKLRQEKISFHSFRLLAEEEMHA